MGVGVRVGCGAGRCPARAATYGIVHAVGWGQPRACIVQRPRPIARLKFTDILPTCLVYAFLLTSFSASILAVDARLRGAQPGTTPAKASAAASVPAPSLPPTPPTIPGQLLLRLKPAFQPAGGVGNTAKAPIVPALTNALKALGATELRQKFPHSRAPGLAQPGGINLRLLYQITVPPTLPLAKARAVLLGTGAVEYVEPLYIRQAQYQPNDPGADSTAAGNQYYLKAIRAYRAWDIYKGDSTLVIGLTDGGARLTHEDLRRQVKRNYADPVDGIDNDGDGYVDNFQGWDLADDDNDPDYNAATMARGAGARLAGGGRAGRRARQRPRHSRRGLPVPLSAPEHLPHQARRHVCRLRGHRLRRRPRLPGD